MHWQTLTLTPDELAAVNTLCHWLGQNEYQPGEEFDAIVLAGNAALPTLEAAFATALHSGKPLWLAGGIGHATHFLREALEHHPRYQQLTVADRAEAEIMAAMAACWQLPPEQCVIEPDSRNSGENAAFIRRLMQQRHFQPRQVLLMQEPPLQRRTDATFRHCWRDDPNAPTFISWPGWTLRIEAQTSGYAPAGYPAPWDAARFFSLIMGEIPRLRNDARGYGPRGQNFISAVTIPRVVEDAWQRLYQSGLGGSRL